LIYVDSREPKHISNALKFRKLDVTVAKLEVGDILFDGKIKGCERTGVCIERKTVGDFLNSLKGDRLFTQVSNMKENFDHNIVAIIGTIPPPLTVDMNYQRNRIMGSTVILENSFNIIVKYFPSDELFFDYVETKYKKTMLPQKTTFKPLRLVKKSIKRDDIMEDMICTVRGIGRKRAKEILKSGIKLRNIFLYPDKHVKPNVPKKTYERFVDLLIHEYGDV